MRPLHWTDHNSTSDFTTKEKRDMRAHGGFFTWETS